MSSVHPIHYLLYTGLLLVLHPSLFIQSLSKNCLFFRAPVQRESVCKGKTFFRNLQIFSKFFLEKKFLEGFQKACGLSFLAPLHIRKVRYSVQQSALSPVASALPVCHLQRLSLSKAVAKVQTFSVSATFTPYFFAEIFQVLA